MKVFFNKENNMLINKKTLNIEVSDFVKYSQFYLQNINPKKR